MTLKQIWKKHKTKEIAIYKGDPVVYPDYADEILETHGEMEVKDYIVKDGMLVVVL